MERFVGNPCVRHFLVGRQVPLQLVLVPWHDAPGERGVRWVRVTLSFLSVSALFPEEEDRCESEE